MNGDEQTCDNCGDGVSYLSSRGWCDGCEEASDHDGPAGEVPPMPHYPPRPDVDGPVHYGVGKMLPATDLGTATHAATERYATDLGIADSRALDAIRAAYGKLDSAGTPRDQLWDFAFETNKILRSVGR